MHPNEIVLAVLYPKTGVILGTEEYHSILGSNDVIESGKFEVFKLQFNRQRDNIHRNIEERNRNSGLQHS